MNVRVAIMTAKGGNLRFRIDGNNLTASEGHSLPNGNTIVLSGSQTLQQCKIVKTSEADSTSRVTYLF